MGKDSKIEWTHHTFNPWWGCVKVSPACDNCYAETFSKRTGKAVWGKDAPRRFMSDQHWDMPLLWNRDAKMTGTRARVFCGSMCDVMEDREDLLSLRARLYNMIEETPHLDWLLLTKRPQNFERFLPANWKTTVRPNVWLMTTVESQDYIWRIQPLLKFPAVVHGISYEPALGVIPWSRIHFGEGLHRLNWLIAGGESGNGSRPADPDWYRWTRDAAADRKAAFFFKQWGEFRTGLDDNGQSKLYFPLSKIGKAAAGSLLDGREHKEFPTPVVIA